MRILLTNLTLATRTGTEIVTRDLALGLAAAGHTPIVFCPNLGEIAEEIRRAGIPVVRDLVDLTEVPDVIHGHHYVECTTASRLTQRSNCFVNGNLLLFQFGYDLLYVDQQSSFLIPLFDVPVYAAM